MLGIKIIYLPQSTSFLFCEVHASSSITSLFKCWILAPLIFSLMIQVLLLVQNNAPSPSLICYQSLSYMTSLRCILTSYSLNNNKFFTISRPVTYVVLHMVGRSNVELKPSAKPKNNIGGIHPLAYSKAKHFSSILYCFTVPL